MEYQPEQHGHRLGGPILDLDVGERSIEQFLDDVRESVCDAYNKAGKWRNVCNEVAEALVEHFQVQGRDARVLVIQLYTRGGSPGVERARLNPLEPRVNVGFSSHHVCALDGIIYDPLVAKPL